jgi:hypothetical protein
MPRKPKIEILELLREGPFLTVTEMWARLRRSESAIAGAVRQRGESGRRQPVIPDKGRLWKDCW